MKGLELDFSVVSKLLIGLLGITTSVFILAAKSYSSRANKFLAFFILIMSWFQMQPVLYAHWGVHLLYPSIYGIDVVFLLALPALIVLYFKYVTQESYRWQRSDYLLLVPSALQFFNWLNYISLSYESKLKFVQGLVIRPDYASTKTYLHGTIYIYFILLLFWIGFSLFKSKKILTLFLEVNPNKHWDGEHYIIMQRWLKGIYLLYAVMSAMFVFNFTRQVLLNYNYDGPFLFLIPWIRMSILLVFVLQILLYPEVLFGVPTFSVSASNPMKDLQVVAEKEVEAMSEKLENKGANDKMPGEFNGVGLELADSQVSDYLQQIRGFIVKEHPERLDDFTLEKFCRQLNIPKSHFSYLLKYHFKETFVEYRTRLRVELACQLLRAPENKHLTLEAIGENVGFSSRFTFIRAFKKIKGITPSEFLME